METVFRRLHGLTTHGTLRGILLRIACVLLAGYGLLLAALPLSAAAVLAIGIFAVLAMAVEPALGVGLLLFSVPFGAPFNVQVGGLNAGPTEAVFGLLLAAWAARKIIARDVPAGWSDRPWTIVPPIWGLALFLSVIALTLTVTHSLPASLKEIVKWAEVIIMALCVSNMLNRRQVRAMLVIAFAATGVEAGIGIYQTVANVGPEPFIVPLAGRLIMRSYGTFEQPNPFAAYLNLSLPIMVSLVLGLLYERVGRSTPEPTRPAGTDRSARRVLELSALLALPLVGAAFFLSLSRGAWLGFALAAAVMLAFRSRQSLVVAALLVLAGAATLVLGSFNALPAELADRIANVPSFLGLNLLDPRAVLLTDENFAIVDRMAHWFAAWNMFSDYPWLGVGIGNYGVVYPQYGLREWPLSLGHAHNFYLNMLAEAGIAGLSAYLIMLASVLGYAWRVAHRARGMERALAFGILGVFVSLAAHNAFDNLYVHAMNIQFGFLIGVLGRMDRQS
ncbi:MAG: O-antigen ligase family protein [Chloroflexi bacterium]|nr:O-antigen ligase family protein [Chloroflexota bacterium]